MSNEESRDTKDHRNVERTRREFISGSARVGYRSTNGEEMDEPGTEPLGLRSMERDRATIHSAQATQAGADRRGGSLGAQVKRKDGLVSREVGGPGASSGDRGIGIHHSSVSALEGFDSTEHPEAAAPVPKRTDSGA